MKAVIAMMTAAMASCGAGEALTDLFADLGAPQAFVSKLAPAFRGEGKLSTLRDSGKNILRRTYTLDESFYVLDVTTGMKGAISKVEIAFPLKDQVCLGVPPVKDLAKLQLAATEPEFATDSGKINLLSSLLTMSWRYMNSGLPAVKVGRTNYWYSRSRYFCSIKMSR